MARRNLFYHVGEKIKMTNGKLVRSLEPVVDDDGFIIKGSTTKTFGGREVLVSPRYDNGGNQVVKTYVPGFVLDYFCGMVGETHVTEVDPITGKGSRTTVREFLEGKGYRNIEF